jgi:tRNA(Ile)-lysidine synthase
MLIDDSNDAVRQEFDTSGVPVAADANAAPLLHALERKLTGDWPGDEWRDTHVILAVSGGADSVALLRATWAFKAAAGGSGRLFVGHLNHGLRGAEADADEAWLKELCRQLDVPLETATVDVDSLAADEGNGIEAAARRARYNFLGQTAERLGARLVVTAHTADDQVETVLQRIFRGTGLAGLAGIPRSRRLSHCVSLVRPMLSVWRHEVMAYLNELGQGYRNDPSNDDPRHARNRLRHGLLPLVRQELNANVDSALVQLAVQAQEAQRVIAAIASDVMNDCVAVEFAADRDGCLGRSIEIDCTRLAGKPPIVVREVLKAAWMAANWPLQSMGFSEWQLLAGMAAKDSWPTAANLPANIHVRRDGCLLRFTPLGLA